MKVCQGCGKPLQNDNAKFCPVCGASTEGPGEKACPRCGNPIAPGKKFCSKCGCPAQGAPAGAQAAAPPAVPAPEQMLPSLAGAAPKRSGHKGLLTFLILLAVGLLGAGGFFAWRSIQGSLQAADVSAFESSETGSEAAPAAEPSSSSASDPTSSPAPASSSVSASSSAPASSGAEPPSGPEAADAPGEPSGGGARADGQTDGAFIPELITEELYTVSYAIPAQWDAASGFDEHQVARVRKGNLWGLIDKSGGYVVQPQYFSINFFFDGLAAVDKGNKFGFINPRGEEVIPPQWDNALSFSDGLAAVASGGKFGYIDTTGAVKIAPAYQNAGFFQDGLAAVTKDGDTFYIDPAGKKMSPSYEAAGDFSEGLAPVKIGGKWGYVDTNFALQIQPVYEEAKPFVNGLAIVQQDGKQFFIDREQSQSVKVDKLWNFLDGVATAQVGELYGYIDQQTGAFAIPPQYKDVYAFAYGVAPVILSGDEWQFVDKTGAVLFSSGYDTASRYFDNLCKVARDGKYGFINLRGDEVVPLEWEDAGIFGNGMIAVKDRGKWGFLSVAPK